MPVPPPIASAITRLVKPESSRLSTRELIEAHADRICSDHNRVLKDMIQYLDKGLIQNSQIKAWALEIKRDNEQDTAIMRGVLTNALLPVPKFQGLSDAQALETYGRLLVNMFTLEIIGQPAMA